MWYQEGVLPPEAFSLGGYDPPCRKIFLMKSVCRKEVSLLEIIFDELFFPLQSGRGISPSVMMRETLLIHVCGRWHRLSLACRSLPLTELCYWLGFATESNSVAWAPSASGFANAELDQWDLLCTKSHCLEVLPRN